MKNPHNNLEPYKVSLQEIAECISIGLGIEIDQESYRELIKQIEETFEGYWRLKTGTGILPWQPDLIEQLNNTISLLEHLTVCYVAIPKYDLGELQERYILGMGNTDFEIGDSDDENKRGKEIRDFKEQLRSRKKELLNAIDYDNPAIMVARKYPEGWLTWRLFIAIRPVFPKPPMPNYKIENAIYRLLRLCGIQEKVSRDPVAMISRQCGRFHEKIKPHMAQPK